MNNLKAISKTDDELRVANHIILFGGEDLSGEFFTKDTDVKSSYTDMGLLYVDFEHGNDQEGTGNDQDNILGVVDWKTAKIDDKGIFVERVLNRKNQYVEFLEELLEAGVIGTSSQAASGKAVKRSNGEIIEWPLMRDTLTVTPMEPRMISDNVLMAAKSLTDIFPNSKSLQKLAGIKQRDIKDITDLKSAEKFLRDSGMSRTESTAFMSQVKNLGQGEPDEGVREIIDDLKRLNEKMV